VHSAHSDKHDALYSRIKEHKGFAHFRSSRGVIDNRLLATILRLTRKVDPSYGVKSWRNDALARLINQTERSLNRKGF